MRHFALLKNGLAIVWLSIACAPATAQVMKTEDEANDTPPSYKMTVSPAPEPKPALKLHFLTLPVDQVEGNAATFYYKSMIIEGPDYLRGPRDTSDG